MSLVAFQSRRRVIVGASLCALVLLLWAVGFPGHAQSETAYASRIEQFSEPGGYFDTDNLISNEQSYLHPLDELRQRGLSGGVYIGVGPDQNFSYIAQIRPSVAFIVDIRRDNMLLHLLFKALFTLSQDRIEYLSLLFGRPPPDAGRSGGENWRKAGIRSIVDYVDSARSTPAVTSAIRQRVDTAISGFGVTLSRTDRDTIDRFHRTFINSGLSLKFQSAGRAPRTYYPTYRELLMETDRSGHLANYLVSEESFQFVRRLETRDLVIPVVGNLAGDRALAAIGRFMTEGGDHLSAFYVSNVELYLFQDGMFSRFMSNLSRLPHDQRSVLIRSVFGRPIAESVPGYYSASVVQPVTELLTGYERGGFPSYWNLINP